MGASQSSAEIFIDQCLSASISVANSAVSSASPTATSEELIEINNCRIINIPGGITQKQMQRMDINSAVEHLTKPDLGSDITAKIKSAIDSSAEAGFGWADSHAKTVEDITARISETVVNECKALSNSITAQVQEVSITGCEEANIAFIHQEQIDDIVAKSFAKSKDMSTLRASLIDEVDAQGISKAKGFNPTWLVLGIVIIVVIFAFGGFDAIALSVTKPSFLFIIGALATCWGLFDLYKGVATNTPKTGDTPDVVEKKKARQKRDLTRGGVIAGVAGIVTVISGLVFFKGRGKAVAAAAAP